MNRITLMSTIRTMLLVLAAVAISGFVAPAPASAGVSFDFFYSNLSPHGQWLVSGSYGRVWQPAIYRPGWNPYYDGRWVYTDVGWTWDSDYAWGGVPYHYGTWVLDPYYGWVWVPGYTWAPAWVVWRTSPGYIGWAPVRPGFSIGVSFHFGDWHDNHYVFLNSHNFLCPRVGAYAVPVYRNKTIINNTTIVNNNIRVVNNVVHNNGLDVAGVERATGRRISPMRIEQVHSLKASGPSVFNREAIKVANHAPGRAIKATEPVSASTPLPKSGFADRGAGASRSKAAPATSAGATVKQSLPVRPMPEASRGPSRGRKAAESQATVAPAPSVGRGTTAKQSLPARPRQDAEGVRSTRSSAGSSMTRSRGPESMFHGLGKRGGNEAQAKTEASVNPRRKETGMTTGSGSRERTRAPSVPTTIRRAPMSTEARSAQRGVDRAHGATATAPRTAIRRPSMGSSATQAAGKPSASDAHRSSTQVSRSQKGASNASKATGRTATKAKKSERR